MIQKYIIISIMTYLAGFSVFPILMEPVSCSLARISLAKLTACSTWAVKIPQAAINTRFASQVGIKLKYSKNIKKHSMSWQQCESPVCKGFAACLASLRSQ